LVEEGFQALSQQASAVVGWDDDRDEHGTLENCVDVSMVDNRWFVKQEEVERSVIILGTTPPWPTSGQDGAPQRPEDTQFCDEVDDCHSDVAAGGDAGFTAGRTRGADRG
jgi:hypothetical protein